MLKFLPVVPNKEGDTSNFWNTTSFYFNENKQIYGCCFSHFIYLDNLNNLFKCTNIKHYKPSSGEASIQNLREITHKSLQHNYM